MKRCILILLGLATVAVALGAVPKLHMRRIIAGNPTRAANVHDPLRGPERSCPMHCPPMALLDIAPNVIAKEQQIVRDGSQYHGSFHPFAEQKRESVHDPLNRGEPLDLDRD